MFQMSALYVRRCVAAASLTLFALLLTASTAFAQAVTLSWDPNTEPNIAGYTLLIGTQSRRYVRKIEVGLQTSVSVNDLDRTKDNYFAVEAYTSDGLVSVPSQEAFLPANPSNGTTISKFTWSVASPFLVGTPVTFTAAASNPTGSVEYKFLIFLEKSGWRIAQDFSSSASYTWTPAWGDVGKVAMQVWVRKAGSQAPYEAWRSTDLLAVSGVPLSLTADTTFPSPPGQPVTWTTNVAAVFGDLQYKYLILIQGKWYVLRDYAPSKSVTWTPTAAGTYAFQVWIRRATSTAAYDAWTGVDQVNIKEAPLSVTSIKADHALPAQSGTTITWTARTTGGRAGPLQFKFIRFDQQTSSWQVVQDYSPSRTYQWTPTFADEGIHVLQVWVKNAGSTASYDAWLGTDSFEIKKAALQLTTTSMFPVPPRSSVQWKAETPDSTTSLEYAYFVYSRSTGTWSVARAYDPNNAYTWIPSTAGTYALQVWARRSGSSAGYEVWRGTDYLDVFSSPAKMVAFYANVEMPAKVNMPITWTATASGGTATPLEYRFILFSTTSGWRTLQEYSSKNTVTWTPSPTETGTFALQVWVRSAKSTAPYEDWKSTNYFQVVR